MTTPPIVTLDLYRDGGGFPQLSIGTPEGGYRIFGSKFNGSSTLARSHQLTKRDADEIRACLNRAFPVTP